MRSQKLIWLHFVNHKTAWIQLNNNWFDISTSLEITTISAWCYIGNIAVFKKVDSAMTPNFAKVLAC